MPKRMIGTDTKLEIRAAMRGLAGTAARFEAERWAAHCGVAVGHIYRITQDLRPARKTRADRGRRTFAIVPECEGVWYAAQLVIEGKLDPRLALETTRVRMPDAELPSLEYFQFLLREKNLGAKQRRNPVRAHRRFEAERPCQIFQIDVTGLKTRWKDESSRAIQHIEGVDKNHPEKAEHKLRVWQILLKDDFSRRTILRYVTAPAITSAEMVRFLCDAFTELGVPEIIYTDQGGEFKGRHKRAERILNSLPTITESGGFRHMPHTPHNPQATGKVESGHKWAERMDRLIGLAISEGQCVTLDDLNTFAERICDEYNHRMHRTTGQTPIERWHSVRVDLRKLPAEVVESALLSEEFEAKLNADMTVADGKGKRYKVPGERPFVDYIGKKVSVVIPANIDIILLTLPDHSEWELEKVLHTADVAGEYKRAADTEAEQLTKALKAARREEVKAIKAKTKLTGEIAPVPHLNVEMPLPETNVANFPHAETHVSAEELGAAVPGITPVETPAAASADHRPAVAEYTGRLIGYWEAVAEYAAAFEGEIESAKSHLLTLYPGTAGTCSTSEVEAFISRLNEPQRLRAVS